MIHHRRLDGHGRHAVLVGEVLDQVVPLQIAITDALFDGSHWNQELLREGPLHLLMGSARPVLDDERLGTGMQGAAHEASRLEALGGRMPSGESDPRLGIIPVTEGR